MGGGRGGLQHGTSKRYLGSHIAFEANIQLRQVCYFIISIFTVELE